MAKKKFDPDERFKVDSDPEAAIKEILGGAGTSGEVEMDEDEDPES